MVVDIRTFLKRFEPKQLQLFSKVYYCGCSDTPFFLIANNPDFEYVACLHSPDYKGQDVKKYITDSLGVANIATFKGNSEIYNFLNQGNLSYEVMMKALDGKEKLISNKYDIKKRILRFPYQRLPIIRTCTVVNAAIWKNSLR